MIIENAYDKMNAQGTVVLTPQESMAKEEEMSKIDPFLSGYNEEESEEGPQGAEYSMLAGEILRVLQKNKDAKENSLITRGISQDLRAVQGEYDPEDLALIIKNQQSTIFMNLPATKSRAAQSWIRDILLNPNNDAFAIEPTPSPALPSDIETLITEHFEKEADKAMEELKQEEIEKEEAKQKEAQAKQQQEQQAQQQAAGGQQGAQPPQPGQPSPQGAPPQPGEQGAPAPPTSTPPTAPPAPMAVSDANDMMLEQNRLQRDIKEAVLEEINNVALFEVKVLERKIADQMKEGNWDMALSEFIEDFCTFSAAIMKGPVITKKKKLIWEGGEAVTTEEHVFMNKRVSPYDVYPDPSCDSPQEGAFVEHLRMSEKDVRALIGLPYYKDGAIREVIANGPTGLPAFDTQVEYEKASLEKRGTEWYANEDVYHGLHFWSSVSAEMLEDWHLEDKMEEAYPDWNEDTNFEIEAILVGSTVIKCKINNDPLQRRPYYKASYQSVPGSFWGRSLPSLMRDVTRVCNATARALVTNMGYSSGPILQVNVDRLADEGDIEEIRPLMTVQVTNDPTGNSGRPVEAFLIPSVANELLAVYDKFEIKADDATGIPRYAYGNERVGGAGQTASGLSMLMDSATKSIKDAIRHISYGLIIPRVEYEFYWLMIKDDEATYSGDICVLSKGAEALTTSGAQEAKRNEFLQITANQIDQGIMGAEGRAVILREMAKDLNLPISVVPTRLEFNRKKKEAEKAQSQAQQMEMQKEQEANATGLKATQIQVEGQQKMHQESMQLKMQELQGKQQEHMDKMQVEIERLRSNQQIAAGKNLKDGNQAVIQDTRERDIADQRAAIEVMKTKKE